MGFVASNRRHRSARFSAKRAASELGTGEPVPELNGFIEAEPDRHREAFSGLGRPDMLDSPELELRLNGIFRQTIKEAKAIGA